MGTLARRVKLLFLLFYFVSSAIFIFMTWALLEGLEKTTLEMDKQVEIEHFKNRQHTDDVTHIKSATITLTYIPNTVNSFEELPIIFNDLPIPFDGEVDFMGTEYTVIINQIPEGTYFFAKDLTLFEQHETRVENTIKILIVLAIVVGLAFSILISRKISRPFSLLTQDIKKVEQGVASTYLSNSYKDKELNDVADVLNNLLEEIDILVKRERSLITMAGHELRTPIAVILGAAEVLERRQNLDESGQKTLQRIIDSANIMSANVRVLLDLVTHTKQELEARPFSLMGLCNEVIENVTAADPLAAQRLVLTPCPDVTITSNIDMVRILLTNLVMNGLNHNTGGVSIEFGDKYLEVKDQGLHSVGLGADFKEPVATSGLGLYIVAIVSEYLGWKFTLTTSPDSETSARLLFP